MRGFFQNIYRVSRQFSSAAIVSTVPSMIARSFVPSKVVFQESELPDMPDKSISIPSVGEMTNEFLIRQSSILSAEAASRLLVLLVSTVDSNVKIFLGANNELANLYEMSAQYYSLTESGEDRIVELRQIVKEKRAELRDLEVLFQYAKKLLDANAEIAFLVGEEFCSTNTSQAINAATNHIEQKMIGVKMAELDLIEAHKIHIEKTGKN